MLNFLRNYEVTLKNCIICCLVNSHITNFSFLISYFGILDIDFSQWIFLAAKLVQGLYVNALYKPLLSVQR